MKRSTPFWLNYFSFAGMILSVLLLILIYIFGATFPIGIGIQFFMWAGLLGTGGLFIARQRNRRFALKLPISLPLSIAIIVAGVVLAAAIMCGLPAPSAHPIAILLILYSVGLITFTVTILLSATGFADVPINHRITIILVAGTIAVAALLVILYIGRVPAINVFEEPDQLNLNWSMISLRGFQWEMYPLWPSQLVGIHASPFNFLNGWWTMITQFSLEQARLFYVFIGWLALPFIYVLTRRLYGQPTAFAALAIATFLPFSHTFVRRDIFVTFTTAASLYLLIRARDTNRPIWHYLTGLVVSFGLEGHIYAIRFLVAFGALYLFDYVQLVRAQHKLIWSKPLIFFSLGALTFAAYYLIVHALIVPGQGSFIETLTNLYSSEVEYSENSNSGYLSRIFTDNTTLLRQYIETHLLEATLAFLGAVVAIRRRLSADKLLLTIYLIANGVGALLLAHVNPFYWPFNLAFVAVWGGAMVVYGVRQISRNAVMTMQIAAVIAIIAAALTGETMTAAQQIQPADPFIEVAKQINSVIPREITTVAGDRVYYLGILNTRRYIALNDFGPEVRALDPALGPSNEKMPAWAVILTTKPEAESQQFFVEMREYIAAAHKEKAYCYSVVGYEVTVYLPSQYMSSAGPVGCD